MDELQDSLPDTNEIPNNNRFTLSGEFRMVAKTMQGLEDNVGKELLRLGAREIETHRRAVSFVGDMGTLYKTNYQLRTALRVLIPVAEFEATTEQEFYDAIRALPWEERLTAEQTLAVDCTLSSELFTHSFFMAQKTKDAVVDRFRDKFGIRPSVDTEKPTLRINIHINDTKVTVSLDSSGESLHKRGYREDTGRAPMNEVLAAGLISLTGWDRRSRLIDPMCGSGTILIEAALMANNIPAGWYRESFGFQRWPDFDAALWETITESAINKISNDTQELIGIELSFNTLRKARTNIKLARVDDVIKTQCMNFFDYEPPKGRGTLILNPPYGERMVEDDVKELYGGIGRTLKHKYAGYEAWMITSNPEGLKEVGLRPSKKIPIFNGPLECRFVKYELYDGSKKASKNQGPKT